MQQVIQEHLCAWAEEFLSTCFNCHLFCIVSFMFGYLPFFHSPQPKRNTHSHIHANIFEYSCKWFYVHKLSCYVHLLQVNEIRWCIKYVTESYSFQMPVYVVCNKFLRWSLVEFKYQCVCDLSAKEKLQ